MRARRALGVLAIVVLTAGAVALLLQSPRCEGPAPGFRLGTVVKFSGC